MDDAVCSTSSCYVTSCYWTMLLQEHNHHHTCTANVSHSGAGFKKSSGNRRRVERISRDMVSSSSSHRSAETVRWDVMCVCLHKSLSQYHKWPHSVMCIHRLQCSILIVLILFSDIHAVSTPCYIFPNIFSLASYYHSIRSTGCQSSLVFENPN